MPFISVPIDDAKEMEAVPEGEYDLRIIKAEDGESKKGNPMTTVMLRIENAGIPNPAPVRHWITHVTADTPEDQKAMRLLDTARFLQCFGIPHESHGFNSDDLEGATGTCMLTQEENEENGEVYNRLRLPRLRKR